MKIHDPKLPNAIICDLDGTLALFGDANPYDRDFLQDRVNKPIKEILQGVYQQQIILLSGRSDGFRLTTEKWLQDHDVKYDELHMRKAGDVRKDSIVKEEFYREFVENKYNVSFVLDDRLQVCRLWYSLGLPLLKVGDPDADF